MGDGLIFSPAKDPLYKPRRKHISQAFYKEKLAALVGHLKKYTIRYSEKWLDEIENSSQGYKDFDLSERTEDILIENAFLNVVGEELADTPFVLETIGDEIMK